MGLGKRPGPEGPARLRGVINKGALACPAEIAPFMRENAPAMRALSRLKDRDAEARTIASSLLPRGTMQRKASQPAMQPALEQGSAKALPALAGCLALARSLGGFRAGTTLSRPSLKRSSWAHSP